LIGFRSQIDLSCGSIFSDCLRTPRDRGIGFPSSREQKLERRPLTTRRRCVDLLEPHASAPHAPWLSDDGICARHGSDDDADLDGNPSRRVANEGHRHLRPECAPAQQVVVSSSVLPPCDFVFGREKAFRLVRLFTLVISALSRPRVHATGRRVLRFGPQPNLRGNNHKCVCSAPGAGVGTALWRPRPRSQDCGPSR